MMWGDVTPECNSRCACGCTLQVKPRTKKARWSIAGESGVKEQGLWEGLSAEQKEDYYRLADGE
jgi:hypothetical protein